MKYSYIILLSLLITGCVKNATIEFTGVTPGIKNGVFLIKDVGDSSIYGENIKNGRFIVKEKHLQYAGYYKMSIINSDSSNTHNAFEVYLEPGKYAIETQVGKLNSYPKITSPSKIQEQLSAYYTAVDKLDAESKLETDQLNERVRAEGASLSAAAFTALINKLSKTQNKLIPNNAVALKQFLKQYPNSEIGAHLMVKFYLEQNPVAYDDIYKMLPPADKNTDEGKDVGEKLSRLVKLVPGAKAPAIVGKMPDGKSFDQTTVKAKLILIDFWRASNEISRRNHEGMVKLLAALKDKNKLGIVSVSIDTKRDWWMSGIAGDQMSWPQVTDLKGDDSPNAANWSITRIPTYYLLDSNWKIIERDINIEKLSFEIGYYLNKYR